MVGDVRAARKGVRDERAARGKSGGRKAGVPIDANDQAPARARTAALLDSPAPPWSATPGDHLPLPPELSPFKGVFPDSVLELAARRARAIGAGGDEVLIATGRVTPEEASACLAAALGLKTAEHLPAPQGGLARAALATGVLMEEPAQGGGRFSFAVQGRDVRRLMRALKADPGLKERVQLLSPADLRRHLLAAAGESLCAGAAYDLLDAAPERSAATLRPLRLAGRVALGLAAPLAAGFLLAPGTTFLVLQALFSLVFLSWIALRLAGCAYEAPADAALDIEERALPLYSLLVPLYREAASVPRLVEALSALDYPPEKLDIKLVVEADDRETRAAIAALDLPACFEEVAVPAIGPRTKPKALNMALPFARGKYVAIYDAEDAPAPDQLHRALAAFRSGGRDVACVQARLAIDNGAESWVSGHFAAEYAAQFDVLLPVLSALNLPILLGGTSNHFRRDVLEAVGAWDPFNVTEDADLGVRLARAGWRTLVIASTTQEEAPVTLSAWLGQRTRWLKGWAQTLLVHGRRPRALTRELGLASTLAVFLLAAGPYAAALLHPVFLAVFVKDMARGVVGLPCTSLAEVAASALTYTTLLVGYVGTALVGVVGLRRRGLPARAGVIATIPVYWLLLSLAAWRALGELVVRPHFWRKTAHGVSRRGAAKAPRVRSSASARPRPRPADAWY